MSAMEDLGKNPNQSEDGSNPESENQASFDAQAKLAADHTSAAETSRQEFQDLIRALTVNSRFHIPAHCDGFGQEYSEEGYALEDGSRVWIQWSPPRTREGMIEGIMFCLGYNRAKAIRVAENAWYDGKPEVDEGAPVATIKIERGKQKERFTLFTTGRFSREFFPGHSEEGQEIVDDFAEIGQDELIKVIKSGGPIDHPAIRKYIDYMDSLEKAAEELEEAGYNITTEAEARRVIGLLEYINGDKNNYLLDDLEFYQRIVADSPEHYFTENHPRWAPYQEALEKLRRLRGEV